MQNAFRERQSDFAFSNFGSLKSTEISLFNPADPRSARFSNFGSLKSTEILYEFALRQLVRLSAISAR